MSRLRCIFISGIIGALTANAGQIQIGGANGLTSAYITGNGGSLGNWGERSYANALFEKATITGATSNGSSTVPTTAGSAPGPSATMQDNNNRGVVFNLVNDGVAAAGNLSDANNVWASVIGSGTITIPIGVAATDRVWIMMNDYWGYAGTNPVLTFNFSNSMTGAPTNPDAIMLTNANNGPIRSSFECASVTAPLNCPANITGHGTVAAGSPLSTSPVGMIFGDATLYTSTIWSGNFITVANGADGPFKSGTKFASGTATLDDVLFDFGTKYTGKYLQSIIIAPTTTGLGNNVSRLAVSAVTVEAVPEPSTLALFATGFGLLGLTRFRRR